MPNTAAQHRTDRIANHRSRQPARRTLDHARPQVNDTQRQAVVGTNAKRSAVVAADVLEDRARIARELHDSVAQTLYAIGLVAGRALALPQTRAAEPLEQLFDQVLQLASDGQAEVRALLANLWADEPQDVSLDDALVALAAKQERCHGLQVRLALAPEQEPVPAETAHVLAAIANEALSNVVRHGAARHVDLELESSVLNLTLVVADDGRGFDPTVARPAHFGLRSMRERAQALGGQVHVSSAAGAGTRLDVCIPRHRSV